jgi:glucose-1-phosphate adenylyltransferase
MEGVTAFILASGAEQWLSSMFGERDSPLVPFGGSCRLVDVSLSNCLHSGVRRAVVVTSESSTALAERLSGGWIGKANGRGMAVEVLGPPEEGRVVQSGETAPLISELLAGIPRGERRDVLILSAEDVYAMDYRPFLAWHRRSRAVLTFAVVPSSDVAHAGMDDVEAEGIGGAARSWSYAPWEGCDKGVDARDLVSTGVCLFRAETLQDCLAEVRDGGSGSAATSSRGCSPRAAYSRTRSYVVLTGIPLTGGRSVASRPTSASTWRCSATALPSIRATLYGLW